VSDDGAHTVLYYSVDRAGNMETEQQSYFTILHTLPFSIEVSGGVGISVVIRNNGSSAFTNVPYRISLDGGIQLKANETSGKLLQLLPGASTLKKLPVLGFGKVNITVAVDTIQITKKGFVFLFFVLGVQ
jgi:hypothetical protein